MAVKTNGVIVRINDSDIGDLQGMGDVKISRSTKDYSALNSDNVIIAVGRVGSGDMSLKVLLDENDSGAQKTLHDAVMDGSTVKFEIELPDKKTDEGNGTKYTWEGCVVTEKDITPEEDGFLLANFNLKTPGKPVITAAS